MAGQDLALILRVAEENTAALKRIQADVAGLGTAANNAGPSFVKLSSSFAVGQVAATAAIGAITGLTNAFVGAVRGAVDLSASLEQTRIGLTSMLGSGAAANKMLSELQSFAETTTFNFPALADGAKRMLAMGFAAQDIIPMLGDMGNAVGAVGGGTEVLNRVTLAFGQMQAKGKVSSEEMRQLAEAGIPVWELLAKAIGKTTEQTMKMVENREISSGTFFQAFQNFSREKWGDMQAQQARTFTGAMSNVQDVIGRLAVSGFANLFAALTHGANLLFEFLKSDRATRWAADFNASIGAVLNALRPLGDALKSILGIGSGGGAAVAQAAAAPALSITSTVQAGADTSKEAIKGLDEQARGVTQTIHGINQQMTALNEQSAALKFKTEDTKKAFDAQLRPLRDIHDELQQAARDAKEGFDQFLIPLKDRLEGTKRQIGDIKSGYADQISAVKDKIDALQGVNDTLRKEQDILADIEDLELRRKGLLAQGDPVKKAELQNKLDDIGFDKDHIANQIQLLTLRNKNGDNDKQIARMRREQNTLDAQAIEVREKIAGLVDRTAAAEVKRAQALQAAEKAEQAIARKKEDLAVKEQVDPLKQQVKDLEAARDAAVAPLEANAKMIQGMYDRFKASQEEALAGIERKQRDNERAIQDTERAQRAALEPLQEQADVLERQRSTLQLSSQHWQNIKQGISDSKAELEAAAKAAKEAGLTQGGGPKDGGQDKREILDPRDVGLAPPSNQKGKSVFDAFLNLNLDSILANIKASIPKILDQLEVWGKAFLTWIDPFLPQIPGMVADVVIKVGNAIIENGATINERLQLWGRAFVDWLAPRIPDLILELAKMNLRISTWILTEALPEIVKNIAEWGLAFIQWVAPYVARLPLELGKLLARLSLWVIEEALPEIVEKVGKWAEPFLGWVGDVVKDIPTKLGSISGAITTWLNEQADKGSGLMLHVWNLGAAIINQIGTGIGESMDTFKTWLKENFVDKLPEWVREWLNIKSPSGVFREIGTQMIAGLQQGIEKKFPDVQSLMGKLMGNFTSGFQDLNVGSGEIANYIRMAAMQRGIDPNVAVRVAMTEGGVTEPAARGTFATGSSWWPFQLHYGGPGYEYLGTVAGMGNSFTRDTGFAPGDPAAWRASVDYALDHAARRGWGAWYGAAAAGIGDWEGIKGRALGGPVNAGQTYVVGERGAELLHMGRSSGYVSPGTGGGTTIVVNVAGSVTSENDLIECIRRGLIQTARRNGYSAIGGLA